MRPTPNGRRGSQCELADGSRARVVRVACDDVPAAAAAVLVSATIRLISGRHEPQLVPARSALPMPSTLVAVPAWIASRMVASPTLKQAQTMGPALESPSAERPDNSTRRASSASVSASNSALTASHCGAASAGPMNRQPMSAPSTNAAVRKTPRCSSTYSASSVRSPSIGRATLRQISGPSFVASSNP